MPSDRAARRPLLRRASAAAVWLVIGVVALVVSALAHLDSPVARRATCEELERQLDAALAGDFAIDRCVSLSLREVRVEGFRVRAPDGTLVLDVRSAVVLPDLRATIGGVPTVREVAVDADTLDLRDPSAIGEAFAAKVPSPPSITPTILPRIEVERVRVRLARLALPEALTLTELTLEGAASLGPSVRARDVRVTGAIRRGEGEALALAIEADADLGTNATSTVRVELSRDPPNAQTTEATAHVAGEVRWGAMLEDGPVHVDARTELAVVPDDARALGVPELAGLLGGPLRLELHVAGWLDALEAEGTLHAGESSSVRVEGSFATTDEGERARAHVATEGVALSALVGTLPDAIFAGEVEVTLEPAGDARRLSLRGDRLAYDRWTVPRVEADATLRDDVLQLERLALPHLTHDGRLDVTGTFGEAIEIRFDVDVPSIARDANVRALAPGADARVIGRGRFALRDERLDVELDVTARDASGFGVRARELSVRGDARGELERPRARLTIGGSDVRVAGETIERVDARVVGGPNGDAARYALEVDARSGARRLRGALDALVRDVSVPDVELSGTVDAEGVWPSPLRARLTRVRARGETITIGAAEITDRGGAMLVQLAGSVAPGRRSNVHALVDVELAAVEQAYGLAEGLRGRVHVEGALQGALASPEVLLSATATDLAVRDLPSSTARIEATLTPGVGATLSAELRGAGALEIDATLRSEARALAALDEGTLDARVKAEALSLALLALVLPDAPPLAGTLSIDARAQGTREAPVVTLALEGDDVAFDGGDPIDLSLDARWSDDALETTLGARDPAGPFVDARLRAPLARDELATLPTDLETWLARPIVLDVDVPTRALPSLPRPLAQALPIELGVHLEARGGASPRLDARLAGRWLEVSRVGACGDARPSFGAEITFDGTRANVTSTLRDAGGEARLEAHAAIPWRTWLRDGFVVPTLDATLRSEALALERLPYACESLSGIARVDVSATGLLGDAPNVRANVDLRELRTRESPVVDARIAAEVDARTGRVDVAMIDRASRRTTVAIDGAWDWTWSGTDVPNLDDAPWRASARFDDAAIAPLVAMVPQLAEPSGAIDGTLRAAGRGFEGTPDVSGSVTLRDVGLTLRDPFVRVSRVQGGIALRDGAVVIDGLRYRDLDGSLRVDGRVGLTGLAPSAIDLRVRARDLPARVEGVIFAYVSADVRVEGDLAARDRRVLDVSLEELAVRVPEESGRSVQSLERHPDVTYVDALPGGIGALAQVTTAEETIDTSEPSVPIEVRVRSTPFWVRRDDFAFQLDANVRSTTDAGGTRLEGPLTIRRGYIELLGKRFELQPGEIRFSGGSSVDPRLELTALHQLRTGEKVYVDIGGYLSAPTLAFRSPDVDAGDERAVIDLLVRGGAQREAEVAARDQATSVLAGMLAGFLSSMTRRELGAFLPVFRIEAEDARSARVRAGFQADRLIPSWLEGVVRGIYVEGFLGAEEQSGQARAAGGFLLELLFPYDLVGAGKWEQGNNWSLDISWEPR